MIDEAAAQKVQGGRGRQRRREGGRDRLVKVRLAEDEAHRLEALATKAGVTAPRFLVEAALLGDGQMVVHRHAFYNEFLVLRRQFIGAATNLNQLAHHVNATGNPPAAEVLADVAGRVDRLAALVQDAAIKLEWSVTRAGVDDGDGP